MLQNIKNVIKNYPFLFDLARRVSRKIGYKDSVYDYIVSNPISARKDVYFIQIGASEGIRNDPFREHIIHNSWGGILVEPIPWVFEKLKNNYSHRTKQNLLFVNAAISVSNDKELCLYTYKQEFLNELPMTERVNYQQKTSFDKKWVAEHSPREGVIEEILVPSYTITSICNKYSVKKDLDLLAIDAEGLDADIIMSIDFDVVRPKLIFFEYHTLGDRYEALIKYLNNNDYTVKKIGVWDAVAELKN